MSISDGIKSFSEPVNKLLVPVATSAGRTLQDIWDLVFGSFDNFVEKKRLTREKDMEAFRKSLNEKVASIPKERLQEPSLAIVGPALEASKYYFEEKTLREMFANLVASALDKERSPSVHPSFVEIIKQMSALDAQNLTLFVKDNRPLPIAQYRIRYGRGYAVLFSDVFLSNPNNQNIDQQAQSIGSLSRIGLIVTDYNVKLGDKMSYNMFEKTETYKQLLKEHSKGDKDHQIIVKCGAVSLTPLGIAFKSICLPQT